MTRCASEVVSFFPPRSGDATARLPKGCYDYYTRCSLRNDRCCCCGCCGCCCLLLLLLLLFVVCCYCCLLSLLFVVIVITVAVVVVLACAAMTNIAHLRVHSATTSIKVTRRPFDASLLVSEQLSSCRPYCCRCSAATAATVMYVCAAFKSAVLRGAEFVL